MKKSLLLMGMALMAFASCSQDEIREVNRGNAIDFRTPSVTKATETTTSNLEVFYASAYMEGDTETSFFSDTKFTKMVDHFVSSPEYFWPDEESTLNFYAYSPSAELLGASPAMSDGKYTLTYSPASDISTHVDLITATASGNSEDSQTGIVLEFAHRLSQIQVNAYNDDTDHVIKVKGVRIGNVIGEGTVDFSDGTWTYAQTPVIESYETLYDEPKTLSSYYISLMNSVNVNGNSYSDNAMVIPQTFTAWDPAAPNAGGTYLGVLINITTKEGAQVYPAANGEYGWVSKPISGEWVAGKKYNYNLDFTAGAGYDNVTGEQINNDIIFTLNVGGWSEVDADHQVYADLVGTWKANQFVHIDYRNNSNIIDHRNEIYVDCEKDYYYDENENLTRYCEESDGKRVEEDYTGGVISRRVEYYRDRTVTITYDESGAETGRTEVESINSGLDFEEGAELTSIAGGGFAYFRIGEDNTNLIIILDAEGNETETKLSFTLENDYMKIPSLDGTRTVPHVDEISVDSQTGNKSARLSIDRRTPPEENHLQYIYYDITPNN